MTERVIFAEAPAVVAMRKAHAAMGAACNNVGDASLAEHAFLVASSEFEAGASLKRMRESLLPHEDCDRLVRLLESKEFAVRVRDRSDRRGFALKATSKGRTRIELVDEAMGVALVSASDRLSEQTFEHLVMQMRACSDACEPDRRVATLFPGIVLLMLCGYHEAVANESAYLGMTALQMASLCALVASDAAQPEALARKVGVSDEIMELQLARLESSQVVVRDDETLELADEGRQRVGRFLDKIAVRSRRCLSEHTEGNASLLQELGAYCIYLFS